MPKKRITIPVFIPHTGCPHCCVFCNQWRVTGSASQPDKESVAKTIDRYLSAVPPSVQKIELAFFGGSFTGIDRELQERYLSWIQPYIKKRAISSIRLSTRPDYIDETALSLLKRYHVETVELGVQSFDDEVLEASGRGHSSEDSVKAVNLLKKSGFRTGIQLLPGLPKDTPEKSIKSAEITQSLKPDDIRIYPAVVLKDTVLEEFYVSGNYTPMTIEETVQICSVMYGIFYENGINVIRMGLHPMDFTEGDNSVVAGPYHPAIGFMIKSRYRRRHLESIFETWQRNNSDVKTAALFLPEKNREEYIGMNRENIFYLKEKFFLTEIICKTSDKNEPSIE